MPPSSKNSKEMLYSSCSSDGKKEILLIGSCDLVELSVLLIGAQLSSL
jgi:hypothetical protein